MAKDRESTSPEVARIGKALAGFAGLLPAPRRKLGDLADGRRGDAQEDVREVRPAQERSRRTASAL